MNSKPWMDESPCKGLHTDLFFPPLEETNHNAYYKVGKAVCNTCPVWQECLDYGIEEHWGLWGGLTPQERRGTARMHHGSLEMFRSGCKCPKCREASVIVRKHVTLDIFPVKGQDFDIESLVYKLSSM